MKLEETESSKKQYVNNFQTAKSHIKKIQEPDIDIRENFKYIRKEPKIKKKHQLKKLCKYCLRYGRSVCTATR